MIAFLNHMKSFNSFFFRAHTQIEENRRQAWLWLLTLVLSLSFPHIFRSSPLPATEICTSEFTKEFAPSDAFLAAYFSAKKHICKSTKRLKVTSKPQTFSRRKNTPMGEELFLELSQLHQVSTDWRLRPQRTTASNLTTRQSFMVSLTVTQLPPHRWSSITRNGAVPPAPQTAAARGAKAAPSGSSSSPSKPCYSRHRLTGRWPTVTKTNWM